MRQELRELVKLCHTRDIARDTNREARIMANKMDRAQALNELGAYVIERVDGDLSWRTTDRTEIAELIRALSELGRAEAWKSAIEGWAVMVENENHPLDWAFFQGSVYANFAV